MHNLASCQLAAFTLHTQVNQCLKKACSYYATTKNERVKELSARPRPRPRYPKHLECPSQFAAIQVNSKKIMKDVYSNQSDTGGTEKEQIIVQCSNPCVIS